MAIVNTQVPITSARNERYILQLVKKYPFFRTELLGRTPYGRPIRTLVLGRGPRKVIFNASHHANEWITSLILLKYAEEYGRAVDEKQKIGGTDARFLQERVTIYMVPMVNPDGVDLVTGAIMPGDPEYEQAETIEAGYPSIPFPEGWKANLLGTDLNLNYPAMWEQARKIKFQMGFTGPAPRNYVGKAPLDQPESRLLAGYTRFIDPALVLAYHTQGREIYWKFLDYDVPGAEELGKKMAQVSGYRLANVPYASGFAGYKDWFIETFRRPGYTVEAGTGENPLPLAQFPEIYGDNAELLTLAAMG